MLVLLPQRNQTNCRGAAAAVEAEEGVGHKHRAPAMGGGPAPQAGSAGGMEPESFRVGELGWLMGGRPAAR